MITDDKKWYHLTAKSLSALLRGITGNNNGDFYCLNCFGSYTKKNRLKRHKKLCENHSYCYVEILKEHNKILKYNLCEKSMRASFAAYNDLECLPEKINTCHHNPAQSKV